MIRSGCYRLLLATACALLGTPAKSMILMDSDDLDGLHLRLTTPQDTAWRTSIDPAPQVRTGQQFSMDPAEPSAPPPASASPTPPQAPAREELLNSAALARAELAAFAETFESASAAPVVHTDYHKAMQEAKEDRKMLFVFFHENRRNAAQLAFEIETLANLEIQEKLQRFVVLKLPLDAHISVKGQSVKVFDHPAFAEMQGRQGIAIIDLAHERADYYGHVVSTFPFTPGMYYRAAALSVILDLPAGTLTQRTMIYAVRIHPERPASTQGHFLAVLADEAKSHADYQASIQVQGHHSWDARFERINAKLPGGTLAQEIVAESWPNQTLVDACVECVQSWRQSPGHWGAVRSRHPLFGYDIKRGRNGIWYATGIFGRR